MVKWKGFIFTVVLLALLLVTSLRRPRVVPRTFAAVHTFVFVHIQKTAGSQFERAIVRRLNVDGEKSCRCPTRRTRRKLRCNCTSSGQPWLISRFSVGWLCGVHADWTTYHRCLPSQLDLQFGFRRRTFLYATLLREPIGRFVSEYLHTLRGATWLSERSPCARFQQLRNEFACWNRTQLNDFVSCPFNPALNRQTRMLSSIGSDCSSNPLDLASAKANLRSMEFFGLTEHLSLSQRLFERTSFCRVERICSFDSYLDADGQNNQTALFLAEQLSSNDVKFLREMNSDDVDLYDYARKLFFHRTCQILGVACH